MNLRQLLSINMKATAWYNLLPEPEKRMVVPILDQVFATTEHFNSMFPGFSVWITGSSLNLRELYHNDIDVMVVVPAEVVRKAKMDLLSGMWSTYKEGDLQKMQGLIRDPRIGALGLGELLTTVIDSLAYSHEIRTKNTEAISKRVSSPQEVNRILLDASQELEGARVRVDGLIELEKNARPAEADGTQGYQFGPLVLAFLNHAATGIGRISKGGQPVFSVEWRKSFSEGYEAGAGDNNCYIWAPGPLPGVQAGSSGNDAAMVWDPAAQAAAVHLFLTTAVNDQKAMEKKESFMLEYYTPQERLAPVRLI